jgi:hypothetical protein
VRRSGPLRRSGGLKRSGFKRKPKPSTTDLIAAAHWYALVAFDERGRPRPCCQCGKVTRRVQGHHVLTQQILRTAAWRLGLDWETQLRWRVENGAPVCPEDHEAHTNGSRRLSKSKLPRSAVKFAERIGLDHRLDPPEYAP